MAIYLDATNAAAAIAAAIAAVTGTTTAGAGAGAARIAPPIRHAFPDLLRARRATRRRLLRTVPW